MCEAAEVEDRVVFISKSARTRLKIVFRDGVYVPYNAKSGAVQYEGYAEENAGRVKVIWRHGRWLEA